MKLELTPKQKAFLEHVHPYLFVPAERTWQSAMDSLKPEKREQVETLVSVGYPTILVPLDTDWEIPGPVRILVVVEKSRTGEEDKVFELGRCDLTDDYRRALLDLCQAAFNLETREGEIHRQHQADEMALAFAADIKRRSWRLFGTRDQGKVIQGFVEYREAKPHRSVVN